MLRLNCTRWIDLCCFWQAQELARLTNWLGGLNSLLRTKFFILRPSVSSLSRLPLLRICGRGYQTQETEKHLLRVTFNRNLFARCTVLGIGLSARTPDCYWSDGALE